MMVEKIIHGLTPYKPTIISGLAYGIDIMAHRTALECKLDTIAVLAHGLHTIYPTTHRSTADKIIKQGGLITEYHTNQKMQPEFFADRNKIIAALCDAVIVVESATKGGALITAQYATEYNRDVFAVPGRANDEWSAGCNALIKNNKAALIDSAEDIISTLRWDAANESGAQQRKLFVELNEAEQQVFDYLKANQDADIDTLTMHLNMQASKLAGLLLEMEIKGVLMALPGKRYRAVT
jgi:DNA processing protein